MSIAIYIVSSVLTNVHANVCLRSSANAVLKLMQTLSHVKLDRATVFTSVASCNAFLRMYANPTDAVECSQPESK